MGSEILNINLDKKVEKTNENDAENQFIWTPELIERQEG